MTLLFIVMLVTSLALTLNQGAAKAFAKHAYDQAKMDHPDKVPATFEEYEMTFLNNFHNVCFVLLGFTVVIGLTAFFGMCYRNSTINRTIEKNDQIYQEERDMAVALNIEQVQRENEEKRKMYEQKYPGLAKTQNTMVWPSIDQILQKWN